MGSYVEVFQSTSPAWGMTAAATSSDRLGVFQSTSPAWGMTLWQELQRETEDISIHIPRVGDDGTSGPCTPETGSYFNPHPPRGG